MRRNSSHVSAQACTLESTVRLGNLIFRWMIHDFGNSFLCFTPHYQMKITTSPRYNRHLIWWQKPWKFHPRKASIQAALTETDCSVLFSSSSPVKLPCVWRSQLSVLLTLTLLLFLKTRKPTCPSCLLQTTNKVFTGGPDTFALRNEKV